MDDTILKVLLEKYAALQDEHHRVSKEQYQRSVGIAELKRQIAHELHGGMYQSAAHRVYVSGDQLRIRRI